MAFLTQLTNALTPVKPFAPEMEGLFLRDYCGRFVKQRRVAFLISIVLVVAYYIFDLYDVIARDQLDTRARNTMLWRAYFQLFEVFTLNLIFLPKAKTSEKYASGCCLAAVGLAFNRNLVCAYYADLQYFFLYYYDGMILSLLVLFGLFRLLATPAILLTIICVAVTAIFSFIAAHQAQGYPAILSSLVVFSGVGCAITIGLERSARYNFLREQELLHSRVKIESYAEELLSLKELAQQQNQDKSKFLADAAHDVRNVMQPVGSFLDASDFAFRNQQPEQAHGYLQAAISANHAMRMTVNALLDISGLESGMITIRPSHFDLGRLLEEVIMDNQPLAQRLAVTLAISKRETRQWIVYSDRQHLKRIISNLVSNGIKYSDQSKGNAAFVMLACVQRAEFIRVDVIDNGIGIPEHEQQNIFKPLYQLNNPERDREQGAGLGLSIVDSTLKLLPKHAFRLRSKSNVGSRFSLILPKGDILALEEVARFIEGDFNLCGLYVLLVENDVLVKASIVALLHSHGAEYEAVSSVQELEDLLPQLERTPDVLVSDYRLPDNLSAVDVISLLSNYFAQDIPVLIITGEISDLSAILPGHKILRKPVEAKQLLAEIDRLGN